MPLVTNVLLIRHGQSKGNAERRFGGHTATPLSARGRKQAEATARTLKSESLTAIYSSDLARAIETARPLANLTGLPINGTSAFRERGVGVMEGLTFEEAAEQHPEQYAALLRRDFEHVLTGGESYRQLLDRASARLDLAIEQNRGGTVARKASRARCERDTTPHADVEVIVASSLAAHLPSARLRPHFG